MSRYLEVPAWAPVALPAFDVLRAPTRQWRGIAGNEALPTRLSSILLGAGFASAGTRCWSRVCVLAGSCRGDQHLAAEPEQAKQSRECDDGVVVSLHEIAKAVEVNDDLGIG